MIISRSYSYIAPNGKAEMLHSGKVAPSNLRRAGVPDALIDAYAAAKDSLDVVTLRTTGKRQRLEETAALQAVKFEKLQAIEDFLADQEAALLEK